MRLLILADGRSPITANWLKAVKALGHEVVLVSSYPCKKPQDADVFHILPIAFSVFAGGQGKSGSGSGQAAQSARSGLMGRFRGLFLRMRYRLGPLSLPFYGLQLQRIIEQTKPDLVHALRIPFEGMTLSFCRMKVPFAVSVWGNDITLHAGGSREMKSLTRRTLEMASGLAADTARDIRLGYAWGFAKDHPTLNIPGSGGVSSGSVLLTAEKNAADWSRLPMMEHLVINPRGFRPGSVRNDTFFRSIPIVLRQLPDTLFICCSMQGQAEAEAWLDELQIRRNTILLPTVLQESLWGLFRKADVSVSVSEHDGTPNSLLEAMTIGCFPIAGDIESIREWIVPGVNGILVDPNDPELLASAIINALMNPQLRAEAAMRNREIIRARAESRRVQTEIELFYQRCLEMKPAKTKTQNKHSAGRKTN